MAAAFAARRTPPPLVVLLHSDVAIDAPPDELDTLEQVHALARALEAQGCRTAAVPLTEDVAVAVDALTGLAPALVFNLVESLGGRSESIHLAPNLLAVRGLPYTGCDSRAMLLTTDKLTAKRIMAGSGIPTPPWYRPGAGDGPWIVKSVWEDASLGIDASSIVPGHACENEVDARARRFGGKWFAERYVDGREFNIALLETVAGTRVLPIAEIEFVDFPSHMPRIVDYAAKWDSTSFAHGNTKRRFELPAADAPLLARLRTLAERCWAVFGLRGYARVDVRVDGHGTPWVLEVNANPCLAPDAGFAAAGARAGLDFNALVGGIAECALPGLLARAAHAAA